MQGSQCEATGAQSAVLRNWDSIVEKSDKVMQPWRQCRSE